MGSTDGDEDLGGNIGMSIEWLIYRMMLPDRRHLQY
jgi:hypothetical protein